MINKQNGNEAHKEITGREKQMIASQVMNPIWLNEDDDWPTVFSRFFADTDPAEQRVSPEFAWIEPLNDKDQRDGFCFAADNLIRDLLSKAELEKRDPKREFHGVLFAALFCYRHYLEVTLKHLISIYAPHSADVSQAELDALKKTHNLMKIWNHVKGMMIEVNGQDYDRRAREVAESIINAFNQVDSSSQVFRYSRDKTGNRTRGSVPNTDLVKLMEGMRSLRMYFDVQDDVLDALQP